MANPEQLALLERGVEMWNAWHRSQRAIRGDLIDLTGAKLLRANLGGADLRETNLAGAILREANLEGADLREADLHEANLAGAILREARLFGAILFRTDFAGAILREANLEGADLHEANLAGAILSGANLREANLSDADLSHSDLSEANLTKGNLHGVDLHGAALGGVILRRVDLHSANLRGVDLRYANLSRANLTGADLSTARLGQTLFADVDLSSVAGLDSVRHEGPCTIGIDTILRSKGEMPEVFLRGAGVPDSFITYAKSLIGSAIEFYSCFISYSTKDQDFADRLYADLQAKGVRCWFAPHDVQSGRKLHEQIDEAIRLHDKLLLILSPHSMASEWVKAEISKARKREIRDQARVLFPISLAAFDAIRDWEAFDADTGKDSAREIREYFIPDFSNWKHHDSYQKAFERLMRDLQAPPPAPAHTQW